MSIVNSNYTSSLAYSLFSGGRSGSTSLASTLASINQEKTSFLTKNANGKYTLPTLASIDQAATPTEKLKAVSRLASSTKIYTDAAMKTGIVTRLPEMTKQVETIMDGLETAVSSLQQKGGLKSSRTTIGTTLSTLRTVISQMGKLMDKLPTADAKTVKESLVALDTQANAIAKKCDLKWNAVFTTKGTATTTETTTKKSNRLLDYLA